MSSIYTISQQQPNWSSHHAIHYAHNTRPHCPTTHQACHGNAFNPDTGELTEYAKLSHSSDGNLWQASNDEIHWLAQGTDCISSTNTMFSSWSQQSHVDKNPSIFVLCAHCHEKTTPHCLHWMVGGNCITYDGNISTKMADLSTAKLFSSMVPTPSSKCMMGNLKDVYLGTPMLSKDYVYMCSPISIIPAEIMDHYNLH